MGSVHRRSRHRRHLTPLEWPSTPEVDGFTWELGPPSEADVRWAAANQLDDEHHTDEPTPLDVLAQDELRDAEWDVLAAEDDAVDRLERGNPLI